MWETWVWSLGCEAPLEKGKATHSSILTLRTAWTIQSMGWQRVGHDWATFTILAAKGWTRYTFAPDLTVAQIHKKIILLLEKEMATHSSVLAWRIPGTREPGGLPSMGLHKVGHDWSDLLAAAIAAEVSSMEVASESSESLQQEILCLKRYPKWNCSISANMALSSVSFKDFSWTKNNIFLIIVFIYCLFISLFTFEISRHMY